MSRPYGRVKRKSPRSSKTAGGSDGAIKIKLLGKDGAPLSMQEVRDGLFEAARRLLQYEHTHRAKRATFYLTMIDEHGKEVLPANGAEWEIHPYQCAADEHGA